MISTSEDLLTLKQAAKSLPNRRGGRGLDKTTLWRWTLRGIHGVKLETILVGGTRFTSQQALDRFFSASTAAADGLPFDVATPGRSNGENRRATRELDAAGL